MNLVKNQNANINSGCGDDGGVCRENLHSATNENENEFTSNNVEINENQ